MDPDPNAPVVEFRSVSRTYGTDPPVLALRGVDLVVERGDAIAIVGPSGSGKSTLLNIVGCLDRPTAGSYLMDGIDTADLDEGDLAALRGRLIGFVFQTFNLLAHRTVLENVMLAEVYVGAASATAPTSCRSSSPAVSSSASRSRVRSWARRACCCATSPPATWTPRTPTRCSRSSTISSPTA
jgi:putative ABC transport system ATP-binding protein